MPSDRPCVFVLVNETVLGTTAKESTVKPGTISPVVLDSAGQLSFSFSENRAEMEAVASRYNATGGKGWVKEVDRRELEGMISAALASGVTSLSRLHGGADRALNWALMA
jgi:hypothetical protein